MQAAARRLTVIAALAFALALVVPSVSSSASTRLVYSNSVRLFPDEFATFSVRRHDGRAHAVVVTDKRTQQWQRRWVTPANPLAKAKLGSGVRFRARLRRRLHIRVVNGSERVRKVRVRVRVLRRG